MRITIHTINGSYAHGNVAEAPKDNNRVLVHQEECDFLLMDCQRGDVLHAESIIDTPKGLRAVGVTFAERPPAGERVEGTVTSVQTSRGFAFMKPTDGGPSVFLGCREFTDYREGASQLFTRLRPGDRVSCERVTGTPSDQGRRVTEAA